MDTTETVSKKMFKAVKKTCGGFDGFTIWPIVLSFGLSALCHSWHWRQSIHLCNIQKMTLVIQARCLTVYFLLGMSTRWADISTKIIPITKEYLGAKIGKIFLVLYLFTRSGVLVCRLKYRSMPNTSHSKSNNRWINVIIWKQPKITSFKVSISWNQNFAWISSAV